MDPFAIVVLIGLGGLVLFLLMVGRANQDGAGPQFGLRSGRQIVEAREALDAEDLDQLLEATNRRRRDRGLANRTEDDVIGGLGADAVL